MINEKCTPIIFFSISGALGFLVDALMLYALKDFLGLFVSRLLSFMLAVFVTWQFNRNITFYKRNSNLTCVNEFISYFSLMILGGLVNLLVYVGLVVFCDYISEHIIFGVAAGSAFGMIVNFTTSRWLFSLGK